MTQQRFKDLFDIDREQQPIAERYPILSYTPFWMWVYYE